MRVHCFYHRADLDGHCSAATVLKWCAENEHAFVAHGVNYGEEINWLAGEGPESMAVVCDFTPEGVRAAKILQAMDENYENGLVWIDHHETAIDRVGEAGKCILGSRAVGTAACVLTWRHFFPDVEMPRAVSLLGRYDVYDRSDPRLWEDFVLPFQAGAQLYATDPAGGTAACDFWHRMLYDLEHADYDVIVEGKTCLRFENIKNARTSRAAYDCEFEGLLCCAVNAQGNSRVLDAYARPEHKLRILWWFKGGEWCVSLYENGHPDVHCGRLAEAHGGGGHAGAAGFRMAADAIRPALAAPSGWDLTSKRAGNQAGGVIAATQ